MFIPLPRFEIDYFYRYKVTQLSMVPSMWYQLVNHPDFQKVDLSSVYGAHSGAAYLPQEISAKVLKRMSNNSFFSEGYGMSETVRDRHQSPWRSSLIFVLDRFSHCSAIPWYAEW